MKETRFPLALLLLATACGGSSSPAPAPAQAAAPVKPERFDMLVRDDFFAGLLENDQAALDRAMKLCEDTLARDPRHAEAMVWHGGGLILRAGAAFRAGDKQKGMKLWSDGLAEMDRAVALSPDDVGTRIPRGATLLAASPFVPEPQRTQLLDKGLGDYERVLELQKDHFERLGRHARMQLLYGLADGWNRRGDQARARRYFERVREVAPDSPYGQRAEAFLAGKTEPSPVACGGCHAR
jgi:tetratricopeptide (TPR) repeat protein